MFARSQPPQRSAADPGRRYVLGLGLAALAGGVGLVGCSSAGSSAGSSEGPSSGTTTGPASTPGSPAVTAAPSGSAAAAGSLPDARWSAPSLGDTFSPDWLVEIPANPAFGFARGVGGGAGESAGIAGAYHLSRYLVTNAQYAAFVEDTGAATPSGWTSGTYPAGRADHPVLFVSAVQAADYCAWLGKAFTDWSFRLPTEAEWENAARGTAGADYPWGSDPGASYEDGVLTSRYNYNAVVSAWALEHYGSTQVAYSARSSRAGQKVELSSILSVSRDGGVQGWIEHSDNTGFVFTELFRSISADGGFTSPVGAYPTGATPLGLTDLAGNAWEWTSSRITATNGAESGQQVTAIRGGSWYATGRSCTTIYRGEGRDPSGGYNTVGFRIAATPR